jgi:hypothetical protein
MALGCLTPLAPQKPETSEIAVAFEAAVTVTGAQLAAFLIGLPRLDDLFLGFGPVKVSCTTGEKASIDSAIARMEKVRLDSTTFVIQQ